MRSQKIIITLQFELIESHSFRIETDARGKRVNRSVENLKRVAGDCQFAVDASLARVDAPTHCQRPSEGVSGCTEELGKLSEIINRSDNIAAKIGVKPIGANDGFTAQGQLVAALLDVELLQLNCALVKIRAEHDGVGSSFAPTEIGQFRPN